MGLKPLPVAAMVALSLGLVACGGSGSDPISPIGRRPAPTGRPSA
jgi:hypothetical protein